MRRRSWLVQGVRLGFNGKDLQARGFKLSGQDERMQGFSWRVRGFDFSGPKSPNTKKITVQCDPWLVELTGTIGYFHFYAFHYGKHSLNQYNTPLLLYSLKAVQSD